MTTDEPVEQERVVMVWPKALKEAVRELAGPRGMTEYVMQAVQTRLQNEASEIGTKEQSEPEIPASEKEQASESVTVAPSEPVSRSDEPPAAEAPALGKLFKDGAEDLPHDIGPRDDLFSRLMAKTGGAVNPEDLKAVLKPASEIPKPEPKKPTTCPTCGEELIDGECWTCD